MTSIIRKIEKRLLKFGGSMHDSHVGKIWKDFPKKVAIRFYLEGRAGLGTCGNGDGEENQVGEMSQR